MNVYVQKITIVIIFAVMFGSVQLFANELTILHTNDWQSRLLGFGPNSNFTPLVINDDQTRGGISRLATLIEQRRNAAGRDNTLLLDAGDYSMGTLFNTIIRTTGSELQLLSALGYDVITLGNHEFDYRPDGLAKSINSAIAAGVKLPKIVISNMLFSEFDPADDSLEELWNKKIIQPYVVIQRGNLRIGIIGLIGYNAIDVAPNAYPLTFSDPIITAKKMVAILREEEQVELVIVLSHGGILKDTISDSSWRGDDIDLLKNVPGIDIIVGGHSHTPLQQPIIKKNKIIVQAGSEGQFLGELKVRKSNNQFMVEQYLLHNIDDSILGDPKIIKMIDGFKDLVDQQILKDSEYSFDKLLAESSVVMGRAHNENILGNLVTDAMLKATDADIVINTNGSIRDSINVGIDGNQWVSDLFRVVPLGVGVHNNKPGYDLTKVWVTGKEIKNIMEVLLLAYPVKGDSFYPRIAGFQVVYNPLRMYFDQISEIRIGNDIEGYKTIDLSSSNSTLYSLTTNSFVGSFLWFVDDFSYGLLSLQVKDEQGNVITNLDQAVFDSDKQRTGIQEVKEWRAFLKYVSQLPDLDSNGLADLPSHAESRIIINSSYNPFVMYKNASWIMYLATVMTVIFVLSLLLFIRYAYQKIKSI